MEENKLNARHLFGGPEQKHTQQSFKQNLYLICPSLPFFIIAVYMILDFLQGATQLHCDLQRLEELLTLPLLPDPSHFPLLQASFYLEPPDLAQVELQASVDLPDEVAMIQHGTHFL